MNPAAFMNFMSRFLGSRSARLVGLATSVALISLIIRALYLERRQLAQVEINQDFILAGAASIFVVVLGNLGGSVASWLMLRRQTSEVTIPYSITMNGFAQMGKYLPGNVLHLVGRFYLISRLTGAKAAFVFSLFEVLLLCMAGCSLGLFYLHYLESFDWPLLALGSLSLLLLVTGIYIFYRTRLIEVSLSDLWMVVILYVISFVCYGQAFSLLFRLVFELQSAGALLCTALFALAFVVGYVTPGASGGLGVREFVFMILAQPLMDATVAVAVVVLFRFFSIAGDLVFALLAFGVRRFYRVKLLQV